MEYEKTKNGIMYTEAIISTDGAGFVLYPDKYHTAQMIKEAKAEIIFNRDVVSVRVANEHDRDELYRTEIFWHPAVRPLKWYEINADDQKVIREERLKGASIDDFVTRLVLPFKAETKAKNLERFGDKIFDI